MTNESSELVHLSPGTKKTVTIVVEVDQDYTGSYAVNNKNMAGPGLCAPRVMQMMELNIKCPTSKIRITME